MKAVVVTGVSSGIGNATARALLDRGYYVFGSVRRQADAAPLVDTYRDKFVPLVFDVTDETAIAAAAEIVSERIGNVCLSGLINNAGIGISGPVLLQPMDEIRKHFDVNVFGPISVVRAFVGMLGGDEHRHPQENDKPDSKQVNGAQKGAHETQLPADDLVGRRHLFF